MNNIYQKSLQMIKILKVKNKNEYNRYKNYYLVLNIESLKYITGQKDFRKIIQIANKQN